MEIYSLLEKVRKQKPVIHHLTNWVTIYDCANIVKAFGGSPVMAHAKEEVADMVNISSALVLNIGTLTIDFIESMKIAAQAANKKGIPVILDVCGAGATKLRDDKCFELLDNFKIDIIKGNASEIAKITGENVQTKGVDSGDTDINLIELAKKLSEKRNSVVVITGKEDIIANQDYQYIVKNGDEMMGNIVGTGCMAASVIGTFAAIENELAKAAAVALSCFGISAELATTESCGPGSFKEKLFDAVYNLNDEQMKKENILKLT